MGQNPVWASDLKAALREMKMVLQHKEHPLTMEDQGARSGR